MPLPRYKIYCLFIVFLVVGFQSSAQEPLTQTIRGKVIDKDSRVGLPGANIILVGTKPPLGTSTDENGNFVLKNVPIGRQSLQISYTGYQTVVLPDIVVRTGKEPVLAIELQEEVKSMREVEIVARQRKDQPINPMAMVSARSFSIDETNKYAGSYGDPARMVANYAGVVSSRDNRNDIIIRGNSPMGLQYLLNGVEITNPNHFSALGTTGGPVTMLNVNLLANSDFLTSAFPASYGNALSGVFDLKMRTGNPDTREYWGELSFNGLEFGLEGPFSKKSSATYLAAYRYSLTGLLENMGIKLKESAQYQDLSFNLAFPTKKAGTFKLFGMGGTSKIKILDSDKPEDEWTFPTHGEDIVTGSSLGVAGLSHLYFFNNNTRILTRLSVVSSQLETRVDTFSIRYKTPFVFAGEKSGELKYNLSSTVMKKFNAANNFDFGISADLYDVNYADSQYVSRMDDYRHYTGSKAGFYLLQTFTQWKHKFGNRFSSYIGLRYLYLTLNGTWSLDPRLAFSWNISPTQSLNFGAGLESQIQPHMMYFVQTPVKNGGYVLTNKEMGFSKSGQFVLGYNALFSEYFRLKVDTYYQYLFNIPVSESIPQYSIINEGTEYYVERQDSLVNKGTGINYGLEFTLEKFFSRNYFFLFTASLYQSQYKGYDGITRNTAFNGNFVLNGVGGYELPLGKTKQRALIFGLRVTWAGGRPYVPYDQEATVKQGQVVYDWEDAYKPRFNNYFRTSLRIGLRRNEKKFNMEFYFDLQYRANYTYVYYYRIDVLTGDIYKEYDLGFYPMAVVRIQF
ncbi:MAG: TonB-dependent receptor [Chlorobi bacterium]|nr:TonB-dependent receptor [Chlorobiota bacterium]